MPHGTSRWSATVPITRGGPVCEEGDVEGLGGADCGDAVVGSGPEEVVSKAPGEPPAHPVRPVARARVMTGTIRLIRSSVTTGPGQTRSSSSSSSACTSSGRSIATKWLASSRV